MYHVNNNNSQITLKGLGGLDVMGNDDLWTKIINVGMSCQKPFSTRSAANIAFNNVYDYLWNNFDGFQKLSLDTKIEVTLNRLKTEWCKEGSAVEPVDMEIIKNPTTPTAKAKKAVSDASTQATIIKEQVKETIVKTKDGESNTIPVLLLVGSAAIIGSVLIKGKKGKKSRSKKAGK